RGEDIRFFRRARQCTKRDHICITVEKNLFDVVLKVGILDSGFMFLKRRIHFPGHVAHPNHRLEEFLICARGLIGHGNVVSLHIEDEKPSLVLGHRYGFGQFGSLYPEEMTEYAVHGGEGEGHPTGGAQELTAIHAQVTSLPLSIRNDLLLQEALPRSLGDGQVFLIGDNLGGHWQMAIEPRVEIRFTDPSIVDLGFRAGRNGLWIGHIQPPAQSRILSAKDYCSTTRFTTVYAPFLPDGFFVNLNGGSGRTNCECQGTSNP